MIHYEALVMVNFNYLIETKYKMVGSKNYGDSKLLDLYLVGGDIGIDFFHTRLKIPC